MVMLTKDSEFRESKVAELARRVIEKTVHLLAPTNKRIMEAPSNVPISNASLL